MPRRSRCQVEAGLRRCHGHRRISSPSCKNASASCCDDGALLGNGRPCMTEPVDDLGQVGSILSMNSPKNPWAPWDWLVSTSLSAVNGWNPVKEPGRERSRGRSLEEKRRLTRPQDGWLQPLPPSPHSKERTVRGDPQEETERGAGP